MSMKLVEAYFEKYICYHRLYYLKSYKNYLKNSYTSSLFVSDCPGNGKLSVAAIINGRTFRPCTFGRNRKNSFPIV